MLKPSRHSRGARLSAAAAAIVVTACAAPKPLVVAPAFADRAQTGRRVEPAAERCRIVLSEVADGRRTPEMLGVVDGRAIKAPGDVEAWLRSILGGLEVRGFSVTFAKTAAPAGAVLAKAELQRAWLTSIETNKSANVVMHLRAERDGVLLVEREYRGSLTRINWATTDTELQNLVTDAFSRVLDDMSADLHKSCGA